MLYNNIENKKTGCFFEFTNTADTIHKSIKTNVQKNNLVQESAAYIGERLKGNNVLKGYAANAYTALHNDGAYDSGKISEGGKNKTGNAVKNDITKKGIFSIIIFLLSFPNHNKGLADNFLVRKISNNIRTAGKVTAMLFDRHARTNNRMHKQ